MSVNGASTIFGIASSKIQRVSLQRWLIIERSPAFLGKTWLWEHRDYVLNICVNRASTTLGLVSWKMQRLGGNIKLWSNYLPPFYAKMVGTTLLLYPKNEHQQSINDFWPCILNNTRVVRRHWPIIELSAAFLGKNSYDKIVTMSHNERQGSVNGASTECQQFLIFHLR